MVRNFVEFAIIMFRDQVTVFHEKMEEKKQEFLLMSPGGQSKVKKRKDREASRNSPYLQLQENLEL
jgi:hypothetical protein